MSPLNEIVNQSRAVEFIEVAESLSIRRISAWKDFMACVSLACCGRLWRYSTMAFYLVQSKRRLSL